MSKKRVISDRTKVLSWFRYHHYKTNAAEENHAEYIGILGRLEMMSGVDTEVPGADEMYAIIKRGVLSLSDEDAETLLNKIQHIEK